MGQEDDVLCGSYELFKQSHALPPMFLHFHVSIIIYILLKIVCAIDINFQYL